MLGVSRVQKWSWSQQIQYVWYYTNSSNPCDSMELDRFTICGLNSLSIQQRGVDQELFY